MQKLSRYWIFILLLASCSSQEKNVQVEEIPNAPDLNLDQNKIDENLTFEDFLSNAVQYYQSKDAKSLQTYINNYKSKFITLDQRLQIRILEAMLQIAQNKFDNAQTALKALTSSKNNIVKGKAWFYLAEITKINKKPKEAIPLYKKAYQFYAIDEILISLADTYSQMSDWKNAIPLYQKLVKNNPADTDNYLFLGACYFQDNRFKDSATILKKLLVINPKDGRAYQVLAQIAKLDKDMRNYYYYLGRAFLLKKDYASTIGLLSDQEVVYKDSDLSSMLISSLVRTKESQKALDVYQRSIKSNPKLAKESDFKIYYGLLDIMPQKGILKAQEYFKNLAKQYPNNFLVVSTYADIIEADNKTNPLLESLFLQVLFIDPTDTASRYKLASFYQDQNKVELAALEYGILYYYQDQKDLALETLLGLESHHKDFKNIQMPLYIGLIYQEMGQKPLAKEYYNKALNIDKTNVIARLSLKKLTDK